MSESIQESTEAAFQRIPAEIRKNLLNISVKLAGIPQGQGGEFICSGVILYSKGGITFIATAKHNVQLFNGFEDPPKWDQKHLVNFKKAITIYYDDEMAFNKSPAKKAEISFVHSMLDKSTSWSYDVIILHSRDKDLAAFAKKNQVPLISLQRTRYVTRPNLYLARNGRTFIQTGYGFATEKVENGKLPTDELKGTNVQGALQYRITEPLADQTVTVYGELSAQKGQYFQHDHAIQLKANENDSSAPGDSGGPLFVYTNDGEADRLYLIGVTTGADMAAREVKCPSGNKLRENGIAASLGPCYQEEETVKALIRDK
ncbi:MAG: trypsin-like serine protease [Chloroflexi bacterium]|nr:trypsin-like serine protease [Chloroflexota bacterium]